MRNLRAVTAPNSNTVKPRQAALGVVIVEDMRDVREGLSVLINGTAGFRCAAAFRTMEEALALIATKKTDVILTDIGLPGMSGIDGIRALRARMPDVPILALAVYDSDDQVFRALCAGASGYLLKNTPPARLLDSLKEVAAGGAPMSPEVRGVCSGCSASSSLRYRRLTTSRRRSTSC